MATFNGTSGNDLLIGTAAKDFFYTTGDDTAYGGDGNDVFYDFAGNSTLYGEGGDDTFYSGGGLNTFVGGIGNDTYWINVGDTVVEAAGEGVDTVVAGFSYTLGVDFENLTLTGASGLTGIGNAANNVIKSQTSGADTLDGGAGDDTIWAGVGNDTVVAGLGNDILHGGDGLDYIVYSDATSGVTVDLAITTYQNTGGGGVDLLDGFEKIIGSSFNDTLKGDNGDNHLVGGAGADTLIGRGGNDTYSVDDVGDVIVEEAGGGNDSVNANISWSIESNTNIENLFLFNAAISGTGNSVANGIVGNEQNNIIDGKGGHDDIRGGAGDDTFVLASDSSSSDTIRDFGYGNDVFQISGAEFGLSAGALDPMHWSTGSAPDAATGQFYMGAHSVLYWDADGTGSGAAEALAYLPGAHLDASDFIVI